MNPVDTFAPLGGLLVGLALSLIPLFFAAVFGLGGILKLVMTVFAKQHSDTTMDYVSAMAMMFGSAYILGALAVVTRIVGLWR